MGCGSSNIAQHMSYSTKVAEARPGETEVRRHVKFVNGLLSIPEPGVNTLKDLFLRGSSKFPQRPCLGKVVGEEFKFMSYQEVQETAIHLGSGIKNLNLAKEVNEYKNLHLHLVGVFAKNRQEWMLLDIANILYDYTMVPFYDTLGPDSIPFILEQTNLESMFLSASSIKGLLDCPTTHKLKNLIFFDAISEQESQTLKSKGYQIYDFNSVIENGKKSPLPFANPQSDSIYTLCYTSGTTGNPKGALLSHGNFVSSVAACIQTDTNLTENEVYLSYLPLAHVMERMVVLVMLYLGSCIGFYRGDPNLLKDDIAKLRPTAFSSVPRLYNKFYDGIMAKINAVTGIKRAFAERAIRIKLENLRSDARYTDGLYDKAFAAVKDLFGGRVRFMITGSAPIQRDVIDFLKIAASCPILEGYGSTESTAIAFVTGSWDPQSQQLGGPSANTEFKLVDIPEMNYTSTDLIEGKLVPRGELCMRGPAIFHGYYKDQEKTKEAIDPEGWLHTGDIGMLTENGGVKLIDRKKNIFKLQQGEYIAPEKIEAIYNRAPGVSESFVYGDSLQSQIVAIVVPDQPFVEKWAQQKQIPGTFQDLCKNKEVIVMIQKSINDFGRANKLNSLEIAKLLYLEPQPFSAHDCTTSTFKLQRFKARSVFETQIKELYKSQV